MAATDGRRGQAHAGLEGLRNRRCGNYLLGLSRRTMERMAASPDMKVWKTNNVMVAKSSAWLLRDAKVYPNDHTVPTVQEST